jgi:hypothetical protein
MTAIIKLVHNLDIDHTHQTKLVELDQWENNQTTLYYSSMDLHNLYTARPGIYLSTTSHGPGTSTR